MITGIGERETITIVLFKPPLSTNAHSLRVVRLGIRYRLVTNLNTPPPDTHTHTHTHTHAGTHAHSHTHTHTRARAHARTHARTHTHIHT